MPEARALENRVVGDEGGSTAVVGIAILGLVAFVAGMFAVEYRQRLQVLGAVAIIEEGLSTSETVAREDQPDFTLLVFFSPDDCGPCLYEIVVLDNLAKELPDRLRVLGVVYGLESGEFPAFREGSGIRFPLHNATREIERMLGLQRPEGANRPLTMLIDLNGAVVDRAMAGFTIEEHLQHAEELRELIDGNPPS